MTVEFTTDEEWVRWAKSPVFAEVGECGELPTRVNADGSITVDYGDGVYCTIAYVPIPFGNGEGI